MPIFQLKPSGAIAGSIKWPSRPITLLASSGAASVPAAVCITGKCASTHSASVTQTNDRARVLHKDARAVNYAQSQASAVSASGTVAAPE